MESRLNKDGINNLKEIQRSKLHGNKKQINIGLYFVRVFLWNWNQLNWLKYVEIPILVDVRCQWRYLPLMCGLILLDVRSTSSLNPSSDWSPFVSLCLPLLDAHEREFLVSTLFVSFSATGTSRLNSSWKQLKITRRIVELNFLARRNTD